MAAAGSTKCHVYCTFMQQDMARYGMATGRTDLLGVTAVLLGLTALLFAGDMQHNLPPRCNTCRCPLEHDSVLHRHNRGIESCTVLRLTKMQLLAQPTPRLGVQTVCQVHVV